MSAGRGFQPVTSAAMQAALRRVAERHGYLAMRGPHAGKGNPSALIQALDSGELATVLMADEERRAAINELRQHATTLEDTALAAALRDLASQLADAVAAEDDDIAEFYGA